MPRAPRLLIARFCALGDIVMMQPVVTALRATYGADAVVDIVCLARCQEAAQLLSGVDVVHTVERGTGEVLDALRERQFDYLLDLHGTVRSRSLARSLDVLTFSVDKQAWNRRSLIQGWRNTPVAPFVDRCLAVLRPFNVSRPLPESWGAEAWGALQTTETGPIADAPIAKLVVSLGSSHPGKHLSHAVVDAALHTAQTKDANVVLVGGEAERARAEQLAAKHPHVTSAAGQWNLAQTANAISMAQAVVTGDTVTMHLAAATGRPMAAVWGCTRPSLGLAGWRAHPQSIDVVANVTSPQRPCSKHGATCKYTRSKDPFHPDRCIQKVDASEVSAWLGRVLV
jgi:ADP-heptose:LPS heptosyltransferase